MNITVVTAENYQAFIASKLCVLLYFDASWNNRKILQDQFRKIAEECPDERFAFGEVDLQEHQSLGEPLKAMNVPGICYFYNGIPSKTVIGEAQSIKEQVRNMFDDVAMGIVYS
jgi:hypothetical protein